MHTKEPWVWIDKRKPYGKLVQVAGNNGDPAHEVLVEYDYEGQGIDSEDMRRAVTCVNALAGISDPDALIAAVRELRYAKREWRESARDTTGTFPAAERLNEAEDKLIALLPPEPPKEQ